MFSDQTITDSLKDILPTRFDTTLPPTILPGTTSQTFENYIKNGILAGEKHLDGKYYIQKNDFITFVQEHNGLNLHP